MHPAAVTWHKRNHSLGAEAQGQDTGHVQAVHTWPEEAKARAAWGGQASQGVSGIKNVLCTREVGLRVMKSDRKEGASDGMGMNR